MEKIDKTENEILILIFTFSIFTLWKCQSKATQPCYKKTKENYAGTANYVKHRSRTSSAFVCNFGFWEVYK